MSGLEKVYQRSPKHFHYIFLWTPFINNRVFNASTEPDYYLKYSEIYEFSAYVHTHPIHLHVNHYQLTQNVPSNGFLGMKGDWFDTFAAESNFTFRMKTSDFDDTHVVVQLVVS